MRLLISGYREFNNYEVVQREMEKLLKPGESHVVIHGNCSGADLTADRVARDKGWERRIFPALWNKHGKAAGPIRNQQMIDEGRPDYALIFLSPHSKGTLDMKNRLEHCGVKYTLVNV